MDVSVVICAKNASRTIGECLESVKRNGPAEIVVVDDGSTDNTADIAGRYADQVCFNEGRGLARARQLGAEKASCAYVSYVDSDVVLPETCLRTMLGEMRQKGYAGIHAQVLGLGIANYWQWAEDQHFRMRFNKEGERSSIVTMAAIFERGVILRYGFDPFFAGAGEDGDLSHRLVEAGLRLGISSAFVHHRHKSDVRSFIRQRAWYGRGNARFFWKHHSLSVLLGPPMMFPFGFLVCVRRRSLKMLPYYFLWSVCGTAGMLSELWTLTLRRLSPKIP